MCTVIASGIIGVIFVCDPIFTQVFNTYFEPVFEHISNYYTKYAYFHQDSASADTANNNMNFVYLHYLPDDKFFISLHFCLYFTPVIPGILFPVILKFEGY